jgi:phage regulator Rha-like protein
MLAAPKPLGLTRNSRRFPADLVFRLSRAEHENLRLQFATSSSGHGGRRYLPRAFTEHGAIMAATVLNSKRAIKMSILVVRAFVRMRRALAMNQQLAAKLNAMERHLESHDAEIRELVDAIRDLMAPLPANSAALDLNFLQVQPGDASGLQYNRAVKLDRACDI